MHTEPKDICNSFKEFYETLCSSKPTCLHIQNTFLEHVKSLVEGSKAELDTPIILVDLKKIALQAMPGPDDLTVEFHKHFFDRLSPLFFKNDSRSTPKTAAPRKPKPVVYLSSLRTNPIEQI